MTTTMKTLTRFCAGAALIGMMGAGAGAATEPIHVIRGCHAGYFFTPLNFFQPAMDMLFDSLEANPNAKAVMEIEPYTIKRMKEGEKFAFEKYRNEGNTLRDVARLERLCRLMRRGQIEIVGGAYTQPILHTIGEESAIRQFTYGMRAVEDILGTPVKVYGAQENGMCSQIPQILNAVGIERVVSDTFFGKGVGFDRKTRANFTWVGSDGSKVHSISIFAVTQPGKSVIGALPSKKMLLDIDKSGIKSPLFGAFRDFWQGYAPSPDLPELKGEFFSYGPDNQLKARYVTLTEHFDAIGKPSEPAFDCYKNRTGFGWGLVGGDRERADRKSEDLVVQAERLLAIKGIDGKVKLDDAWDALLCGQHHDARLFAGVWHPFGIFKQATYAQTVIDACDESMAISKGLLHGAGCLPPDEQGRVRVNGSRFTIVNTAGIAGRRLVSLNAVLPKGAVKQPAIVRVAPDGRSPVAAEITVGSRHEDGRAKEITAFMIVQVPAMGSARCEIVEGSTASRVTPVKVTQREASQLDNGLVRIIANKDGVRIAGPGTLSYPLILAGNFLGKGDLKTGIRVTDATNEGPSGVMHGAGELGGVKFTVRLQLDPESPIAQLRLQLDFGDHTDVGTKIPFVIDDKKTAKADTKAASTEKVGNTAAANIDQKFRLIIPLPFSDARFLSHAAFDIRTLDDGTAPILRYAMAEGAGGGIAVFTDRSSGGLFRKTPAALEIAIAYGGMSSSAYSGGKALRFPLRGKHEISFHFTPYQADWRKAEIPKLSEAISQPLLITQDSPTQDTVASLVTVQPEDAAMITAVVRQKDHLIIRLWRPYDADADVKINVNGASKLERTDLLARRPDPVSGNTIRMHRNQIVTLRAEVSK